MTNTNANTGTLRIVAAVIAVLCFLAVLFSVFGDVDQVKIVAAGGLALAVAVLF